MATGGERKGNAALGGLYFPSAELSTLVHSSIPHRNAYFPPFSPERRPPKAGPPFDASPPQRYRQKMQAHSSSRRPTAFARLVAALGAFVGLAACGGGSAEPSVATGPTTSQATTPGGSSEAPHKTEPADKPFIRPSGPLTRKEAERYVLDLVNRDRKANGLSPVSWDETAAKAGQRHAEDMARHGFTAHIGSDGSSPEQRHTDAGGVAMVMENAACFADAIDRELDPDPRFTVEELERIETTFISEVPPMDGHKRNILTPWHTSLGVGLSKTKELQIVCMAQEFTDHYGRYDPLPNKAKAGTKLRVTGHVNSPAEVAAVGIARVSKPKPMKAKELLKTYAYSIPKPYVTYFKKGFKTPIPLDVTANAFSIEAPLSDQGRPGIYSVSVWAKVPQTPELVMISLRTIEVD